MNEYLDIVLKIALSFLFGAMIGFEREKRNRPAGLRTHILVAVGSALITLVSIEFFTRYGESPSRIAANIVVGIGFLGAGTIMKEGLTIRGLTTAASIWVASAIGIACGLGYYFPAVLVTLVTVVTLVFVRSVEISSFVKGKAKHSLFIQIVHEEPGLLGRIGTILGQKKINIENIKFERTEETLNIYFYVAVPEGVSIEETSNCLLAEKSIKSINWD